MDRIGIVGAGAWGTALSRVARRAGREVVIWARAPETAAAIDRHHANPERLPGVELDPEIRATSHLPDLASADAILLAMPAQFLREVTERMAPAVARAVPAVVCAKGIERKTGALMSEIVARTLPRCPCAVLSGPTFAIEVARGQPAAVTIACADAAVARSLADALGGARFRPYCSPDVVGAEVGGAVKNVVAIACGIAEGRELGENARAALITRGLAEMTRLCVAKGGRASTMAGLSGLGDLTLTCSSAQSRNYALGLALGRGGTLGDLLAGRRAVTEGVHSAAAVVGLAERNGIEMPICAAVDAILNRGESVEAAIEGVLARPFRAEGW